MAKPKKDCASLLFRGIRLQRYRLWLTQRSGGTKSMESKFPNVDEYEEYLRWCEQRDHYVDSAACCTGQSVLTEDKWCTATICGHVLHPALVPAGVKTSNGEEAHSDQQSPQSIERCPMCVTRAHQNYVDVVEKAWNYYGGPWDFLKIDIPYANEYYDCLKAKYYQARVGLLRMRQQVEVWLEEERLWEKEHHAVDMSPARCHGAAAAIRLLESDDQDIINPTPSASHDGIRTQRPKKSVSFAPDTLDGRTKDTVPQRRKPAIVLGWTDAP